ncbi:hypothetical protein CU084_15910 [Bacillus velezensis]|nr:hypothetical protein CU084_15910 [Bacillus velezensis]
MIFYSSNSVGFTSQVLLSGWANMYILIKNYVLVMNAILYCLPPIFADEPPFCHASHPRDFLRLRG